MSSIPLSVTKRLEERLTDGSFRRLGLTGTQEIDFYSNDYLGFSRDRVFQNILLEEIESQPTCLTSSTGSRLISGNTVAMEETEVLIAAIHQVESALLFGSGYDANLALFGGIPTHRSTVIVDEYVHRSIHDGCRLSMAKKWKFKHNDLNDLEKLLEKANDEVFVVVESLYSMDGDFAPLKDLVILCDRFGAFLMVDEAHAIGVYGLGLLKESGLQNAVFATTVTYGKAMGVHGAAVLGSKVLKDILINFGSSFIYSTAPPSSMALSIRCAYAFLDRDNSYNKRLFERLVYYRESIAPFFPIANSPIQIVELKYLKEVDVLLEKLQLAKIGCVLIKAPTVPLGSERFRICIHAHNTKQEIDLLVKIMLEHRKN